MNGKCDSFECAIFGRMKKVGYILILFTGVFIIASCKKKENNTTAASGSGTGYGTVISSSSATSWYALFNINKFIEISNTNSSTYNMSQVNFFKTPQPFPGMDAWMVDSVFLNGISLQFLPFQDSSYNDTTGFSLGALHALTYPYTIRVNGKGPIPSFAYTRNGPFPNYTGYSAIPDTIFRSVGFTLNTQTMSNADFIGVTINAGPGKSAYKNVSPPFPAKITFSATDLSQLDTTSYATIEVVLLKEDNLNVNGKPMLFADGLNVTKYFVVR